MLLCQPFSASQCSAWREKTGGAGSWGLGVGSSGPTFCPGSLKKFLVLSQVLIWDLGEGLLRNLLQGCALSRLWMWGSARTGWMGQEDRLGPPLFSSLFLLSPLLPFLDHLPSFHSCCFLYPFIPLFMIKFIFSSSSMCLCFALASFYAKGRTWYGSPHKNRPDSWGSYGSRYLISWTSPWGQTVLTFLETAVLCLSDRIHERGIQEMCPRDRYLHLF